MTDAEDVLARADAWQAAIEARDVEGVQDYLHPDYALVLVHPAEATVPRQGWLGLLPDYVVHAYVVLERTVDVMGDLALVLQKVDQRATVAGADRSSVFVLSDCWLRGSEGTWRVWRRHSTPLAAAAMPRAEAAR
jgi:ketosteroid isomerase-like protein